MNPHKNLSKHLIINFLRSYLLLLSLFFVSCRSQYDDDDIIKETMHNILELINKEEFQKLPNYMGRGIDGDVGTLSPKARQIHYVLSRFYDNKIDSIEWNSPDTFDYLGRRRVNVELYNGYDSLSGLKSATLILHFGPKNLVPLDKVSGFELETSYDEYLRDYLYRRKEGIYKDSKYSK
jgi:hypothetical protein